MYHHTLQINAFILRIINHLYFTITRSTVAIKTTSLDYIVIYIHRLYEYVTKLWKY